MPLPANPNHITISSQEPSCFTAFPNQYTLDSSTTDSPSILSVSLPCYPTHCLFFRYHSLALASRKFTAAFPKQALRSPLLPIPFPPLTAQTPPTPRGCTLPHSSPLTAQDRLPGPHSCLPQTPVRATRDAPGPGGQAPLTHFPASRCCPRSHRRPRPDCGTC